MHPVESSQQIALESKHAPCEGQVVSLVHTNTQTSFIVEVLRQKLGSFLLEAEGRRLHYGGKEANGGFQDSVLFLEARHPL